LIADKTRVLESPEMGSEIAVVGAAVTVNPEVSFVNVLPNQLPFEPLLKITWGGTTGYTTVGLGTRVQPLKKWKKATVSTSTKLEKSLNFMISPSLKSRLRWMYYKFVYLLLNGEFKSETGWLITPNKGFHKKLLNSLGGESW
jgi:hypothetical protein